MPIVVSWVECFLSQWAFQVNLNETLSQTTEAISGVPQGSVIGPIIFAIYVYDLPDNLSADILLYADDVKLIAPETWWHSPKLPKHQRQLVQRLEARQQPHQKWATPYRYSYSRFCHLHPPVSLPTQRPDNPTSFHHTRPRDCLNNQAQRWSQCYLPIKPVLSETTLLVP